MADKKASYEVDKVLTEKFDYSKTPYKSSIIANDSVTGDSILRINNEKISIEDFYNISTGIIEKTGEDDYKKILSIVEYKTPSVHQNNVNAFDEKRVKYIKKHKVKKTMWKLSVLEKEVVVTEDHSIMVLRENKLVAVKPFEIIKNDKILYIF